MPVSYPPKPSFWRFLLVILGGKEGFLQSSGSKETNSNSLRRIKLAMVIEISVARTAK
jgi:hypothetical protein